MELRQQMPEQNLELEPKQRRWQETLDQLDHIVDRLGHPIDNEIKETVASFLVNDLPTNSSCGGHLDGEEEYENRSAPYVSVGYPFSSERFVGEISAKKNIAENLGIDFEDFNDHDQARDIFFDYIDQHPEIQETEEYKSHWERSGQLERRLSDLLAEFQHGRPQDLILLRVQTSSRVIGAPPADLNAITAENPDF